MNYNIILFKTKANGCITQHTLLFIEQPPLTKVNFYVLYNTRIVDNFFYYFHTLPTGIRMQFVPKVFYIISKYILYLCSSTRIYILIEVELFAMVYYLYIYSKPRDIIYYNMA
jgi:hypothetical protein